MSRARFLPALVGAGALLTLGLPWVLGKEPPDTPVEAEPPPVADVDTVRFVALGDVGHANATQREVAQAVAQVCLSEGCDFGLLLGDNLYPRGLETDDDGPLRRIWAPYQPLNLPFYAVIGNHDDSPFDPTRAQRQVAFSQREHLFRMPSRMYHFHALNNDFWAFDTQRVFWFGSDAHRRWLNGSDRKDGWQIAFGHHPFRSSGEHGDAGTYEGLPGIPYASGRALRTFFEEEVCGKVDLYLSGHDHHREYQEHCGVALVVSGTGSSTRPLERRPPSPGFASDAAGFVWVELGDRLRLRFYDANGQLEHEVVHDRGRQAG